MKRIHTTILIIALALFISCDEKKAEDDIKKAFTKITDKAADVVDAVDKATPKLTKPAINSQRARVGTAVTFPKVEGYSYELKQAISGVILNVSDKNTGEVRATEALSGIIIVATKDGKSIESNPIEFVEIIKPDLSSERVAWDTPITFPKVADYTYRLKEEKTGIALSETTGNRMQITATQSAQNVIIVVTDNGLSAESEPIEFTKKQGNGLSFANKYVNKTLGDGRQATHTQTATNDGTVTGDNREIIYEISSQAGQGAAINSNSGEITLTEESSRRTFTVTAILEEDEKYIRSAASYFITIASLNPIVPALSRFSAPWGEEITFPIELNHRYEVYDDIDKIVTLTIDGTTGRLTATESIKAPTLAIYAILGGDSAGSGFEFTRKQGNTLSFTEVKKINHNPSNAAVYLVASNSGTVAEDDRVIRYSISPTGEGVTIDSSSGEVTATSSATEGDYTITAELPETEKYTRATASYTFVVR